VVPSLNVTVPVAAVGANVAVNVTDVPRVEGFVEEATVTVVVALFTVCVRVEETLLLSFASPPYEAVIECAVTESVEVLNVAFPLLSVPVPSVVVPSLNVTVPVAAVGDKVAVNVTEVWYVDGFSDDVSVVVVLALFTVWASVDEVLVLSFVSPPYEAVME
jgi:hypothetical protein